MSQLERICSEMSLLKKKINSLKPAEIKVAVKQDDNVYIWNGTGAIAYSDTGGGVQYYTTAGNWQNFSATTSSGSI